MKTELSDSTADPPFPFRLLHAGWGIASEAPCRFEHVDYEYVTVEYVVQGRGLLESDGRRFECGADSVYFLHRRSNHRYWTVPEAPWHKLFFIVDGPLADLLVGGYRLDRVYAVPGVPQLRRFFEEMRELGYGGPAIDRRAAVIFHEFAEACAGTLREAAESVRPEIAGLKRALDGSIDRRFRLEPFCEAAGYSPAHMIRHFRLAFGCPPYEYLMRRRIEAAQRLLTYSRKSVKEIAEMLRFSDQYYFSGCFKARVGSSPSRYRRRSR
ncbi:AraC family transcriptional regulator [Victivallaceae bacterium BBE-744-WT-12]|uniref:AraC family transcriptional regulator n=1 Tax=Victivallis lenta TaxID=2606640 RepID=A0A844G4I4_9BACT|nr:AraC family transcriptional regulator [Victivallis lenta]AVM46882.1 hypothetical protein C5Q97_20035 [Victivallales bacterium CCUG 44730]MST97822.1 AraC family transcriptional regulator [Victivallis lenta]